MFLPISGYLHRIARLIFSYTDVVKNRLHKFVEEIKSKKYTPEQLATRARAIDDNLKHFLKLQEQTLSENGTKLIPSNLIPKHMHGQHNINDMIKEVNHLYDSFKMQSRNPGQLKFIPDTVAKLIQCFDAVAGAQKVR
jgi:hypothetical protein